MDKGFVFDGLGGGFVGASRNNVWDSGASYLQKRPNAIVRLFFLLSLYLPAHLPLYSPASPSTRSSLVVHPSVRPRRR
jgi:hypothetical protein